MQKAAYPIKKNFPFFSWLKRVLPWLTLAIFLALIAGFFGNQELLSWDILGKAYQRLTGVSETTFQDFFLGNSLADRQILLSYALLLIFLIILGDFWVLWLTWIWKNQNPYLKNHKFYSYQRWSFFVNIGLKIASYLVLTLCFVSSQTLGLFLLFISYLSLRKEKKPYWPEDFLAWQDPCLRQILFFSLLVAFVLPLAKGWIRLAKQIIEQPSDFSQLKNLVSDLINSVVFLRIIFSYLGQLSNFLYWLILVLFIRRVFWQRIKEYQKFWTIVAQTSQQAIDFQYFYHYQKILADQFEEKNGFVWINSYGFFQNLPQFIKRGYWEKPLIYNKNSVEELEEKLAKTVEFLDFLLKYLNPKKNPKQQVKVDFLVFSLFREFKSFEEIETTQKLILASNPPKKKSD